jgi:hypothetical protein
VDASGVSWIVSGKWHLAMLAVCALRHAGRCQHEIVQTEKISQLLDDARGGGFEVFVEVAIL